MPEQNHPTESAGERSATPSDTPIVDAALAEVQLPPWDDGWNFKFRQMVVTGHTLETDLTAARQRIEGLEADAAAFLAGQIAAEHGGADIPLDFTETGRRNWLIGHHKAARIAAESRLAAVEAQAARYEWLKNQQRMAYGDTAVINWNVGHDWERINSENLDEAIDSAIRHLKEKS